MKIAIVGGGINGVGVAWELARKGYKVTLFERGRCGERTSSATTKMIHGGLRYLEGLHIGLVRESLRDRAWLLQHLPELVKPIEILLPIYKDSPRSRFEIAIGLTLYDLLAGRANIRRHRSRISSRIFGGKLRAIRSIFSSSANGLAASAIVSACFLLNLSCIRAFPCGDNS